MRPFGQPLGPSAPSPWQKSAEVAVDAASALPTSAPPTTRLKFRQACPASSAITLLHECLTRDRTQRRLLRRLPHDRVAAHQTDHRVPSPNGDWKVERRDDADRPERMPILGQPMAGPLAGDRLAIKLPAKSNGEIADVDHFLNFAAGLRQNLAGLPGNERRQVGYLLAKFFADTAHQFATHGCRRVAPAAKSRAAALDGLAHLSRRKPPETRPRCCHRSASARQASNRRRSTHFAPIADGTSAASPIPNCLQCLLHFAVHRTQSSSPITLLLNRVAFCDS